MLLLRKQLLWKDRHRASIEIQKHVLCCFRGDQGDWREKNILLYRALGTEVEIQKIEQFFFKKKANVFYPYLKKNQASVFKKRFVCMAKKNQWEKGPLGVEVPIDREVLDESSICFDLVFVPSVALTLKGERLGRGGGYYDQLLKDQKDALKIGFVFSMQVLKHVPQQKWDQKVHWVVSEKGVTKTKAFYFWKKKMKEDGRRGGVGSR